ncbi:FxsA family protein [Shewanella sp. VB17]|uniref:FxsA family protein n=1 Tax=Shewanella sp. VB17 TaxID=2739432 RepID=UPI001564ED64|nr:FxsA family protein [Shewanella sp. VB17]NRD72425.1 FxsA family protein [Shewanella sp. VB17]
MFLVFIVIFILVPVIELNVLIQVGDALGSLTTVGLVFLTAIVGVSLVRSQGISTLMQVQQKLARGEAPGQEIVEGMMLAVAGLLLLIPGFVTDTIGLLLLTPMTRIPVAGFIYKKMQVKVAANGGFQGGFGQGNHSPFGHPPPNNKSNNPEGGDTFDGDFEHKSDTDEHRVEHKKNNDEQK